MIARFAVLAMIFSLMAVALPASAHSVALSSTGPCPATTPNAGFTDISGFDATTQTAINCLFAFGITTGTSATTYSPNDVVPRWQMALFLVRQATDHGLTIPAAASQGYTDIGGFDAATQNAINQITQLGISKGTSTTTFSPNLAVSRWQMALFIYRTGLAAGVSFNSTEGHNDFTDIGGNLAEAQTAINALADTRADPEGHIALGTGGSLFSPELPVLRWQMALFLTRLLAADNVAAPAGTAVVVTPSSQATQATGTSRAYSATVKNADGTNYTGQVVIRLLDANADGTANGTTAATQVEIVAIDGVAGAFGTDDIATVGIDGVVNFLVRHTPATASGDAVPQVIRDSDTGGDVDAGEAIGSGGAVFFTFVPAEATAAEALGASEVCSTDKAEDFFVIDTDGVCAAVTALVRVEYDDNDAYLGDALTMAEFEAALSAGDTVTAGPYAPTDGSESTFTLTDVTSVLTVDAVTTPVDAGSQELTGTGNPGWEVVVYRDQGTADQYDSALDPAVSVATPIGVDGDWSVTVSLNQSANNDFIVVQRAAGSSITAAPAGGVIVTAGPNVEEVPTIVEGAAAQPDITSTVNVNNGVADVLDGGDTLTLDFDVLMSTDFGGDSIQVTDGTDTATLTHGVNATFSSPGADDVIVITILGPLGVTINGTAALNNPVGFQSATGTVLTAAVFNVDVNRNFDIL
jgi:hypothetical protein